LKGKHNLRGRGRKEGGEAEVDIQHDYGNRWPSRKTRVLTGGTITGPKKVTTQV